MALPVYDGFRQFGEDGRYMQKVLNWLVSIQDITADGSSINKDTLMKAVSTSLDTSLAIFSLSESKSSISGALKNAKVEKENEKRQKLQIVDEHSQLKSLDPGVLALRKWSLSKNSSNGLELQGELVSVNGKKITELEKDFYAGVILTRPQPFSVKTEKGVFELIGNLQDPNKEVPGEVKKYFNKCFPINWKKVVHDHWNIPVNGSKGNNSSADSIDKSKLQSTSNNSASFLKSKDESNVFSEDKRRLRKRINSSLEDSLKNDSESCNMNVKGKENKGKAKKKNETKCQDKEKKFLHLKKWTLLKESNSDVVLKGYLYSPLSDELSGELFSAGPVISVKKFGDVITNSGSYYLLGNLHDPDNLIPDEVKKNFHNGFPKSWKNIINEHWSIENFPSTPNNIEKKGKKRMIDEKSVSQSPKLLKVECDEKLSNKNVKNRFQSKIPVKIGKKSVKRPATINHKPSLKTELELVKPNNKRNTKRIAEKTNEGCNISEKNNDGETNSSKKVSGQKNNLEKNSGFDKSKKNKKSNVKVNKKRTSINIVKKRVSCEPAGKRKGNTKVKKKEEVANNLFVALGVNMSGFNAPMNKTSDFFKTFDNDCIDGGIPFNSFKEMSLGECVKSAERKMKGKALGKETPLGKYVADVFGHSSVSNISAQNHSTHSANSSPDTKRNDVVKRILKVNKEKKVAKTTKKQVLKNKNCANAEINAVFKQITKKTSALSTTPKIVKKIFRKRTLHNDFEVGEYDSMIVESSIDKSDSENDFL